MGNPCASCKWADFEHPDGLGLHRWKGNRVNWGICTFPVLAMPWAWGTVRICRNIVDDDREDFLCHTFEAMPSPEEGAGR